MGASSQTILSLAPKSVTAGIAVGISEQVGGLQTPTIVLEPFLDPSSRTLRIDDPRVVGLTMGIASHGIGTARALQISEVASAFSGPGMGLNWRRQSFPVAAEQVCFELGLAQHQAQPESDVLTIALLVTFDFC